jgi:hypothetical protein
MALNWFKKKEDNKFNIIKKDNDVLKQELKKVVSQNKILETAVEKYDLSDRLKWDKQKVYSRKDRRKLRNHPEISYIVTMFFQNGTMKDFVILGKRRMFKYMSRTFILDIENSSVFDLVMNQYHLFYYFDETIPISRINNPIPNKIKLFVSDDKNNEQGGGKVGVNKDNNIFFSIKSDNVKPVLKQEYVKILATANQLNVWLKINLIFSAFCVFFLFVVLFLLILMMRNISIIAKVLKGG